MEIPFSFLTSTLSDIVLMFTIVGSFVFTQKSRDRNHSQKSSFWTIPSKRQVRTWFPAGRSSQTKGFVGDVRRGVKNSTTDDWFLLNPTQNAENLGSTSRHLFLSPRIRVVKSLKTDLNVKITNEMQYNHSIALLERFVIIGKYFEYYGFRNEVLN